MGHVILEDDDEAASFHKRLSAGEHIPLSSLNPEVRAKLGIPLDGEISKMEFGTGDDIEPMNAEEEARLTAALAKVFGWDQPQGFS